MKLDWHSYKYYPYERDLASREAAALFGSTVIELRDDNFQISGEVDTSLAERLTYFSHVHHPLGTLETTQSRLEKVMSGSNRRQVTRYSVHGLHEYKGKFNPQVAKALLNIFRVGTGTRVLDPFCGSGTTLVEAAQLGCETYGTDMNPLAVFIARAKLQALRTPASRLWAILSEIKLDGTEEPVRRGDNASAYLQTWFLPEVLSQIELLKRKIDTRARDLAPFFLCVASDLLRNYSNQEPADLRIRRRKSPLPAEALLNAFYTRCEVAITKLQMAQLLVGQAPDAVHVSEGDVRRPTWPASEHTFDVAITSPPYAMALPYIDTQRLSLTWLGLLEPKQLNELEAALIGSREVRGVSRRSILQAMTANEAGLPNSELGMCEALEAALVPTDGFRRRAVPMLLYRYFEGMRDAFANVRRAMVPRGQFALIVGKNRTTLGGREFHIDTPIHLANLAGSVGWSVSEIVPLQTYQRYGLHANNAIGSETLLLLQC